MPQVFRMTREQAVQLYREAARSHGGVIETMRGLGLPVEGIEGINIAVAKYASEKADRIAANPDEEVLLEMDGQYLMDVVAYEELMERRQRGL